MLHDSVLAFHLQQCKDTTKRLNVLTKYKMSMQCAPSLRFCGYSWINDCFLGQENGLSGCIDSLKRNIVHETPNSKPCSQIVAANPVFARQPSSAYRFSSYRVHVLNVETSAVRSYEYRKWIVTWSATHRLHDRNIGRGVPLRTRAKTFLCTAKDYIQQLMLPVSRVVTDYHRCRLKKNSSQNLCWQSEKNIHKEGNGQHTHTQ